jgi:hypothetical protein
VLINTPTGTGLIVANTGDPLQAFSIGTPLTVKSR